MAAKYTSSGSAIRATSSGCEVIASPCSAKRMTIVNSRPYRANGPMRGSSSDSYQARPLALSDPAGEVAGGERDAEEDQHAAGDLPHGHIQAGLLKAEPPRQHREVEPAESRERDDLEDGVQRDQDGGGLAVAARKVVPDDDHGDTAGQPDDDQARAVLGQIRQEQPRQREHERRSDDPVQQQGGQQQAAVAGDGAEAVVAHFGEDRVHHHEQAERDRQRYAGHGDLGERVPEAGHEAAEAESDGHRGENPDGQVAVEERQAAGDRLLGCGAHAVAPAAPAGAGSGSPAGRMRMPARRSVISGSSQ